MSRPLDLDFLRESGRPRAAPWVVLAIGVACAAATGLAYHRAASESASLEARIADARRTVPGTRGPATLAPAQQKLLAEEVRFANTVLQQMNFPWDVLFGELERAHVDGVTLLGVQPDLAAGRVTIGGEARNYDLALAYVAALEKTDRLSGVFLMSHETRATGALRPIVFTLTADWVARP